MSMGFPAAVTDVCTIHADLEQTLALCFLFPTALSYSSLFSRHLVKGGLFLMRREGPSFCLSNFIVVIYCCPVSSVFY